MKKIIAPFLIVFMLVSCQNATQNAETDQKENKAVIEERANLLADQVKNECLRSWNAYKKYAWGHDALKPLSKTYSDWYSEPLYISPIDAYSTLYLMGFAEEAKEIEIYVVDSLSFDKDVDAKIFEVNIRILGGLLSMYELSENPLILEKACDFADRMLPAFHTKTGIPKYWVNLRTGKAKGDTVNVAEAASYLLEMGVLSYHTKDPKYYQAAKKANRAVYSRRSKIGLIGDVIEVQSGKWVSKQSHICAGVDSYYEYLFKASLLFGDPELNEMWAQSLLAINKYLPEDYKGNLWYGRVDMETGEKLSAVITLYDAFFPAILGLSGDVERAEELQKSWAGLWNKYGLEPMVYDYKKEQPNYPAYDLNPEIIESAYYLFHITGDSSYYTMNESFWSDIKRYCKTEVAFTSVQNVETMKQKDYMPTFFFAETLKYLYLTFSHHQQGFDFDKYVFNTEAHPFKKANIDKTEAKIRLGF